MLGKSCFSCMHARKLLILALAFAPCTPFVQGMLLLLLLLPLPLPLLLLLLPPLSASC